MFIDFGSEVPKISDDEVGEAVGTLFSREDLFSLRDSDGENVDFILSSADSSDEDNFQDQSNKSRFSNIRNHALPTFIFDSATECVGRECKLGKFYGSEIDSKRTEYDTDQDINSQPSSSADSPVSGLPSRKYPTVNDLRNIPEDSSKTRRHLCQFKSVLKQPRLMYVMTLLSYVCFMCFGSIIFKWIEKSDVVNLESLNYEIMELLQNCQCLSAERLEMILTELSNITPGKVRNYIAYATNRTKSNANILTSGNIFGVQVNLEESSWSFGDALFFCMSVVTTIGYGHISPRTHGGKVFCVIFACIGIPFTLHITSSTNNQFLIPMVFSLRHVFMKWVGKNQKSRKKTSFNPVRFPHASNLVKTNTKDLEGMDGSSENGNVQFKKDIQPCMNMGDRNAHITSQPPTLHANMSGEVNESFDDADMNATASGCLKLRRISNRPSPVLSHSTKVHLGGKHATVLESREGSDEMRKVESTLDRRLADFVEKRKISRKHYSTVSKTSVVVNVRSKNYSVVQPPLNLLDLFRVVRRNPTTRAHVLFLLIICTIVISTAMMFPAIFFTLLELEWSYLDALYFCFISLTTIGLGDLVPGKSFLQNNSSASNSAYNSVREVYLTVAAIYLITGASMMMLMVRTYRNMMELERKAKRDRLYTKLQRSFTDPTSLNVTAPRLTRQN